MWAKDANIFGSRNWNDALPDAAISLSLGTSCGGEYTDWRLPNANELASLVDKSNYNPALPTDHPFTDVQSYYWSSTTYAGDADLAWYVNMDSGNMDNNGPKINVGPYVWPVRGGN